MTDATQGKARLFLVDDHPTVRHGLALMFTQAGYVICGEAGSVGEALQKLADCTPDLAVLDLSLDDENGLDLVGELKRRRIKSLVHSMYGDAAVIENAFRVGADGYVTKRDDLAALPEAVREILAGRPYTSPCAAQSLAHKVVSVASAPEDVLTDREKTILELFRRGNTTIDIAAQLKISTRTVESHYVRIIEKLGLEGMKAFRLYVFAGNRK